MSAPECSNPIAQYSRRSMAGEVQHVGGPSILYRTPHSTAQSQCQNDGDQRAEMARVILDSGKIETPFPLRCIAWMLRRKTAFDVNKLFAC